MEKRAAAFYHFTQRKGGKSNQLREVKVVASKEGKWGWGGWEIDLVSNKPCRIISYIGTFLTFLKIKTWKRKIQTKRTNKQTNKTRNKERSKLDY